MNRTDITSLIKKLNKTHHRNFSETEFLDLNTKKQIIDRYEGFHQKSFLDKKTVQDILVALKRQSGIKMYTPYKYFEGLSTQQQIRSRFQQMIRRRSSPISDPRSYSAYKTDKSPKTITKSKYTEAFEKSYGEDVKSLEQKSRATGIPLEILDEVFRKGKAAWRTGHRIGANEDQWGYARVHSFIMLGCTAFGADFYLFKKAVAVMKTSDVKKWASHAILCPQVTLEKPYYKKYNAAQFIKKL